VVKDLFVPKKLNYAFLTHIDTFDLTVHSVFEEDGTDDFLAIEVGLIMIGDLILWTIKYMLSSPAT
jgi:hypothetical protein